MYSPQVIERRVAAAEASLGFKLERHSIQRVEQVAAHLEALVERNKDGEFERLTRDLLPDEVKFVRNERRLAMLDFRYWVTRYAVIKDHTNQIIKFTPNLAQSIALDTLAQLEADGRTIMMQKLKARQLGISTFWELLVEHRTQFYPNVIAIVGSSDPDKSAKMNKMLQLSWDHQPWWLKPQTVKFKTGEFYEYSNGTTLSIQHGTQNSGIGRGDTPTVAHLSEICDYDDPASLIDAGFLRAVHDSPWVLVALESTANGRDDWWHQTWESSKEFYREGTARLYPFFLPWFVGRDIYPTPTWLRTHPIPDGYMPNLQVQQHAEKANEYVRATPLLRKHLGDNWKMPLEQMWFYEANRREYQRKGILSKWYSEMPADDHEAFQSNNTSIFDAELISEMRDSIRRPKAIFGIRGADVPTRLQPAEPEIRRELPTLPVRAQWAQNEPPRDFELVPLKCDDYSTMNPNGKLIIWELPESEEEYGVGVDAGYGVGADNSLINVVRKGTIARNDAQVAEYANPWANAADLSPLVLCVGTLYSAAVAGRRQQAKLVIECATGGENIQNDLRKWGWMHFHQRVARPGRAPATPAQQQQLGWYTTGPSRDMMLDLLLKYLRDRHIDVNSPWLINELTDFIRTDAGRLEAAFGKKDDRIMSIGIVTYSLHLLETLGKKEALYKQRMQRQAEARSYPIYRPSIAAHDVSGSGVLWKPGEEVSEVIDEGWEW